MNLEIKKINIFCLFIKIVIIIYSDENFNVKYTWF